MKRKMINVSSAMFAYSMVVSQYSKDDGMENFVEKPQGKITIGLTVIPSDFRDIQNTFVTIAEIRLDGEKLEGFKKQTIDLSAYQEGDVKLVFNGKVQAKKYSSLSFIFDFVSDETGNSPGCCIVTENDKTIELSAGLSPKVGITFKKSFTVKPEKPSEVIVGIDLRKSIIAGEGGGKYHFASTPELHKVFRVLVKDNCGQVKGNIIKPFNLSSDLYVFIYKKGGFDRNAEIEGRSKNDILFPNAVGSSKVRPYGSYQLPLLEEGEYEIHLATCDKNLGTQFLFRGKINPTSNISGLLLNSIPVSAKSHIQLNIDVLGVI
jgi:hypothetical protein